jgi:hypothetical protein
MSSNDQKDDKMVIDEQQKGNIDDIVTRLAREDKTPWYKKPNLRMLYFLFFPTCLGVEMTSGSVLSVLRQSFKPHFLSDSIHR